jgi:hypothetical protein
MAFASPALAGDQTSAESADGELVALRRQIESERVALETQQQSLNEQRRRLQQMACARIHRRRKLLPISRQRCRSHHHRPRPRI